MVMGKKAAAAAAAAAAVGVEGNAPRLPPNVGHGVRVTLAYLVLYYLFLFAQANIKRKLRSYYAAQGKKPRSQDVGMGPNGWQHAGADGPLFGPFLVQHLAFALRRTISQERCSCRMAVRASSSSLSDVVVCWRRRCRGNVANNLESDHTHVLHQHCLRRQCDSRRLPRCVTRQRLAAALGCLA